MLTSVLNLFKSEEILLDESAILIFKFEFKSLIYVSNILSTFSKITSLAILFNISFIFDVIFSLFSFIKNLILLISVEILFEVFLSICVTRCDIKFDVGAINSFTFDLNSFNALLVFSI